MCEYCVDERYMTNEDESRLSDPFGTKQTLQSSQISTRTIREGAVCVESPGFTSNAEAQARSLIVKERAKVIDNVKIVSTHASTLKRLRSTSCSRACAERLHLCGDGEILDVGSPIRFSRDYLETRAPDE